MRGLRIVSAVLCLWSAFAVPPAEADAETDAFHAAVAGAYRHYREAVHYFENDNADLGALALDEFAAAWQAVASRFAAAPPGPYATDPSFANRFAGIGRRVADAQAETRNSRLALRLLAPVRADLSEMRRISGQRVFSDCIDAMNASIDRLWAYRQAPPTAAKPETIAAFKTALLETARWYRQCRDEAPAAIRDTEEFSRLFDGALASLAKLEAVDIAQTDALVSILRELHSFDRLIWLRFG